MADHGTRTRYVQDKCRCALCKEANRLYYHELQARRRAAAEAHEAPKPKSGRKGKRRYKKLCPGVLGQPCPNKSHLRKDSIGGVCARCRVELARPRMVSPDRAREHVQQLGELGVGYKAVADAADVGKTAIAKILSGATRWIHPDTERKILEVDVDAMSDGVKIPSGPTRKMIARLRRLGLTKGDIALALGAQTPALQVAKRPQLTLRTQGAVERLLRRSEREQRRHRNKDDGQICDECGYEHGRVPRRQMLTREADLDLDRIQALYSCIYPDNPLARRRLRSDLTFETRRRRRIAKSR